MRLSKWHALGNSYLLVERADLLAPLSADLVRRLCDPHRGIGSDGVLEVVDVEDALVGSVIWNPDGSTAEFSGNGARILAAWLTRRTGRGHVTVRLEGRQVTAEVMDDGRVVLDVGRVRVGQTEALELDGERIEFTPVDVGNPHAVIRWKPDRGELLRLGPAVERSPRFPQRTNVQLVRVDGQHDITVAVWERGAGETLSSGTSSVSAAAAAIANAWCTSPVRVHLPGGELLVELTDDRVARLTGPAEEICAIELPPTFASEGMSRTPTH